MRRHDWRLGLPALAAGRSVFIGGPVSPSTIRFSRDPNGNLRLGQSIQIEGSERFPYFLHYLLAAGDKRHCQFVRELHV